jgi:CHAT domain-containing protein/tetratricopeptide (TPR) repeat protein
VLRENSAFADVRLAHLLKEICLEGWSSDPARALGASATLKALSNLNPDREIEALTAWASGLEDLIHGQMEFAINHLELSQRLFLELDKKALAAATQVSKLIALAILGRYDEAIESGLRAREVFEAEHDQLAIGKIEHNIGNIYFRRDQYRQAERFQRSARSHFLFADDQIQIAKIENSLALTLSQQHQIHAAEKLYQQALARAERVGLVTTQAEIESSIGTLALYQGYYNRALDFLERSRRKYAELGRPHVLAMTEQEIADAYLELNLAPEAVEVYERVTARFSELGMRAEEARAVAYHGRAEIMLGNLERAQTLLARARDLYVAEGNDVGAAVVELTEAQLFYARQSYSEAHRAAEQAELVLRMADNPRRQVFARWLQGESARCEGILSEAETILQSTMLLTESSAQNDIAARCLTSLGLLAATRGEGGAAEKHFKDAVKLIEELRAPLPAEEFRTAFFSDKLVPYNELVKLCLAHGKDRLTEAFIYVERARSRALVDALGGTVSLEVEPGDAFEANLLKRIEELRHQLSYFYNQINQPVQQGLSRSKDQMTALHEEVQGRETKIGQLNRQLQHRDSGSSSELQNVNLANLRSSLGQDRALVEFTSIDDELVAFVVSDRGMDVYRGFGSEAEIAAEVANFRFQIDALRHGSGAIRKHLPALEERARKHLRLLHDRLFLPVRNAVGDRNLVVVPHRSLHYLPFHALYDGAHYLIESREVSYAPSAMVLQQCLKRSRKPLTRALLMGVSDERTPRITDEIEQLRALFSESDVFPGGEATLEALQTHIPQADLVHLACHAQFRPDNPLFSSLQLGDGWLTVGDTYKLKLNCGLVTLSACDTGVNAVAPGDELIGLARGFLSAGSPSVLLSLWTVDDEATAQLMMKFYEDLSNTQSPSKSLRTAQIKMLEEKPHPFFWSPFVLVGRW